MWAKQNGPSMSSLSFGRLSLYRSFSSSFERLSLPTPVFTISRPRSALCLVPIRPCRVWISHGLSTFFPVSYLQLCCACHEEGPFVALPTPPNLDLFLAFGLIFDHFHFSPAAAKLIFFARNLSQWRSAAMLPYFHAPPRLSSRSASALRVFYFKRFRSHRLLCAQFLRDVPTYSDLPVVRGPSQSPSRRRCLSPAFASRLDWYHGPALREKLPLYVLFALQSVWYARNILP